MKITKKIKDEMLEILETTYKDAKPALIFNNPFELLIAVILSAQCTDKRVNITTARLFAKANTPEKILEMATIVVAGRAGTVFSLSSQIEYIENKYDAKIYRLNSPVLEISSNDIRRRVRDGESIRYLLPSKVVDYIYGHNLYQPDPPEEVQKENE